LVANLIEHFRAAQGAQLTKNHSMETFLRIPGAKKRAL